MESSRVRVPGSSATKSSLSERAASSELARLKRVFLRSRCGFVCSARAGNAEAIRDHLAPKFESLHHPMSIRDMDQAVRTACRRTREGGSRSAFSATMTSTERRAPRSFSWVFRDFGFQFSKSASRIDSKTATASTSARSKRQRPPGCESPDHGGLRDLELRCGIERARELGIDLIIVDHHQLDPVKGLPPAIAVLNPQRPDCESGLKQLCGCGLAFYLAMGFRIRGREEGWFAARSRAESQAASGSRRHGDRGGYGSADWR